MFLTYCRMIHILLESCCWESLILFAILLSPVDLSRNMNRTCHWWVEVLILSIGCSGSNEYGVTPKRFTLLMVLPSDGAIAN
jgi:hypothetical protein